jgi:hypothetical protein
MAQYQHIQRYKNFLGVDLKSNDLDFAAEFATDLQNVQFTPGGTLEKRVGYQPHAEPGAKFGIFTYNRIVNGVEQSEILGVSDTVQKLAESTITVTYTGSAEVANIQVVYDPSTDQYRCIVEEGTSVVLDQALGVGRDVGVPYSVNSLTTAINALANFTATVAGSTSTPAAFIKTLPVTSVLTAPVDLVAKYWVSLNVSAQTGKTGPLQGSETNKNELSFENVTAVQLQNCIYFSNGYDPVLKYDGKNIYRAGLPPASDGSTGTFTVTASGVPNAGNTYVYRQQFVNIDGSGNQIEGNTVYSPEYNINEPSVSNVTVTLTSIQAGSGFNTNCAIISASGSGTAIPVTAGHTMKAGDTAFLWDTGTSAYVTRSVVSVGATTVTVDSSSFLITLGSGFLGTGAQASRLLLPCSMSWLRSRITASSRVRPMSMPHLTLLLQLSSWNL